MTPNDLASQLDLYAQSNDNAFVEAIGDAEPGTELHRMRAVYFKWRTERTHAYRHAAEMVREYLVLKPTP